MVFRCQQSSCAYVANSGPKQVRQSVRNSVYRPVCMKSLLQTSWFRALITSHVIKHSKANIYYHFPSESIPTFSAMFCTPLNKAADNCECNHLLFKTICLKGSPWKSEVIWNHYLISPLFVGIKEISGNWGLFAHIRQRQFIKITDCTIYFYTRHAQMTRPPLTKLKVAGNSSQR